MEDHIKIYPDKIPDTKFLIDLVAAEPTVYVREVRASASLLYL